MTSETVFVGFTGQHAQKGVPRIRSYTVSPSTFHVSKSGQTFQIQLHEEILEAYLFGIPAVGGGQPLFDSSPVHLVGEGPHTVQISGSVAEGNEYHCVIYVPEISEEQALQLSKPTHDDNLADGNSPPRIIITA